MSDKAFPQNFDTTSIGPSVADSMTPAAVVAQTPNPSMGLGGLGGRDAAILGGFDPSNVNHRQRSDHNNA